VFLVIRRLIAMVSIVSKGETKIPFKSKSQQRFLEAHPEKLKGKIKEWEQATNFKTLPEKVRPRGKFNTRKG
jgi:hypothetical protein